VSSLLDCSAYPFCCKMFAVSRFRVLSSSFSLSARYWTVETYGVLTPVSSQMMIYYGSVVMSEVNAWFSMDSHMIYFRFVGEHVWLPAGR
jgi:hypothetical protein